MPDMGDRALSTDGKSGITVTFQQIYTQLQTLVLELRDVNYAMKSHAEIANGHAQKLIDHDSRLRIIEKWKYGLPASLFVSFASIITALIAILSK